MAMHDKSVTKAYPLDSSPDPVGFEANGAPKYDRQYSAADLRDLYARFMSDGVFTSYRDEMAVTMRGGSWYVKPGSAMCGGLKVDLDEEFKVIDQTDIPHGQYAFICVEARFDSQYNDGHVFAKLSASPSITPIRNKSNHEIILARIDWMGKSADLRLEQSVCGPVTFRFEADTESFMLSLQTALSQFDLQTGTVTSLPAGATPTVTVRKPEVAGQPVVVDWGIPDGKTGAPGKDGDTAPTCYIRPEDDEPPAEYDNVWFVDDKATHTITALKCYETDRVYPGAARHPGAQVYPGGIGQWVPHKIAADLIAQA